MFKKCKQLAKEIDSKTQQLHGKVNESEVLKVTTKDKRKFIVDLQQELNNIKNLLVKISLGKRKE